MKQTHTKQSLEPILSRILLLFYAVGVAGMIVPASSALFRQLIPWALLLSFVVLGAFHQGRVSAKQLMVFVFIYLAGFVVEAVGVNTGLIFGQYVYGNGLGLKLLGTPLIIGLNWLYMVYSTAAIMNKYKIAHWLRIPIAAALMLLYDLVLEQVAPALDMWHWANGQIPLQNYGAWLLMALFFHSIIALLKIKIKNRMASLILACQFVFFGLLCIWFKLMI